MATSKPNKPARSEPPIEIIIAIDAGVITPSMT
jgi:hypothetical protein